MIETIHENIFIRHFLHLRFIHSLSSKIQPKFICIEYDNLSLSWCTNVRLLWAPIVDSFYWKKFGRRKSWLVPMQYLIGIFLLTFSNYVHDLLEGEISNPHDSIVILTIIFFVITFFTATQDIAVDGWALEILSKYAFI